MECCLFIGGIKSGKSNLALSYAKEMKKKDKTKKLIFIATACCYKKYAKSEHHNLEEKICDFDLEMEQKIAEHKAKRGNDWHLIEESLNLDIVMKDKIINNNIVIIDCINMWLTTNFMHEYSKFNLNIFDQNQTIKQQQKIVDNIKSKMLQLTQAFSKSIASNLIIVSNEVGLSLVEPNKNLRIYTELLAELNQKLAKLAKVTFLVCAGIKIKIKP